MHFPLPERLKKRVTSKKWRWCLVLLSVIWFLVVGSTEHSFFAYINQAYNPIPFLVKEMTLAVNWAGSNPVLFAVVLAVSYCLAVILWAQSSSNGKPQLEIVSVWNEDQVAYQQEVSGVLADSKAPIEVLVYAGNVWHRQLPVKVQGNRWRGKCQFGDAKSPAGTRYKIVAIAPRRQLDKKIAELPSDALKSEIISVVRSTTVLTPESPKTSASRLQFGELNRVDIGPGIGNRVIVIGIHNIELEFWYKCHNVRAELTFTHSHTKETFTIPGWFASIGNGKIVDKPIQSLTLDSKDRRLTWLILYVISNLKNGHYRFVAPGPALEPVPIADWTVNLDDDMRLSFGNWQIGIVVTADGEDKLERVQEVHAD
jgi:hypothetical protein